MKEEKEREAKAAKGKKGKKEDKRKFGDGTPEKPSRKHRHEKEL